MSSTSAASNVILGGSGGGYAGYVSPTRRRVTDADQPDTSQHRSFSHPHLLARLNQEDEVFLFIVKEPVRSILSKLMDMLAAAYEEPPPQMLEMAVAIVSGPLGYRASIRDNKPSVPEPKIKLLPKPITR